MELEKIVEIIEPSVLSIKGVSGMGIVDYGNDGNKKIEIAVQTDEANEKVLNICKAKKIDLSIISVINPGENKIF